MKIAVCLCVLALVAAVYGNACVNQDPSQCTLSCPSGEAKACEHDICTCSPSCQQQNDCKDCPMIHTPEGHQVHQSKHCIDGACVCQPQHQDHLPGQGGNHGPGGR